MNRVCITQANAITAMGPNLDALYNGLLAKSTGIHEVSRFNTKAYISPYAALITDLEYKNHSSLIFELTDRLLEQITGIESDCVLLTSSTKGAIDLLEKNKASYSYDRDDNILPSYLPVYISHKLGLKDNGININAACASSAIAVSKGTSLIMMGHADMVLICCMDIISEFVFSGFSALQAMSPTPAAPFDKTRQGLTLGEGAAAILLMSEKKASALNISPLAYICGWGIANDATHVTAPARDAKGLKLAVTNACKQAGIQPDEISAINAHGTATVYNDAMEIAAITTLFPDKNVVVNSIKGAIGHTLGAAGGIEVALCIKILENNIMPGTIGFCEPDVGTENIISSDQKVISGDFILTTNSGFGGINAAIIMSRPHCRPPLL